VEASARQGTDADLGTLQILQDADRTAGLALQGADRRVDPGVIVLGAVAEVEAEGIDSRQEQAVQHLRRRGSRPDGGDDLGVAVAAHLSRDRARPPPWNRGRRFAARRTVASPPT